MRRPNAVEREIDAIRVKLYEEIKGMSSSEMTAYMEAKVAPFEKKFGLKFVDAPLPREQNASLGAQRAAKS
jgi:hypothetical protein